jgi:hypothetical protein
MIVKVTQEHISKGCKRVGDSCPVTLAIKEELPNTFVWSDQTSIQIGAHFYETPPIVKDFITNFDANFFVAPIEFTLELP